MVEKFIYFSDLFDASFTLSSELGKLTKRNVFLEPLTDSKFLFGVIRKKSRTSEKLHMIDIKVGRVGFKTKESSNIGLVFSQEN